MKSDISKLAFRTFVLAGGLIAVGGMSGAAPSMADELPAYDDVYYGDFQGFFECVFDRFCTDWRMGSINGYDCFFCTGPSKVTHCDPDKPLPTPLALICVQNHVPGGCGVRWEGRIAFDPQGEVYCNAMQTLEPCDLVHCAYVSYP